MFFRKIFGLFFILLLFGALFGMNGRNQSQFQAGYVQGYVAGQQSMQTAEGGTAVAPPPAPYYPTYHYPGYSFFSFFIKGFVLFFGFMLLMGLLFGRGRRHGGHGPKPLRVGRRWHKWHEEWHQAGHKPPWYDADADEPVMKA
ncbi:MAG TPA: hypothetical protein PLD25_16585 [Chloroflexota bacterium]|nr:hypothetical protein [Chloroflexota bacterium]HUM71110.1 hypothetical protein [Chloroflexota bacterium]